MIPPSSTYRSLFICFTITSTAYNMEKTDRTRSSSPLQLQVYLKNIEPHCFVEKKDAAALQKSVLKEKHRLDLRNSTGLTVLETAAKADYHDGVKVLLDCGANATMINQETGQNAFHVAAQHASTTTLTALMVQAEFPALTEKVQSVKQRLQLAQNHLKTVQENLKLAREHLAVLESQLESGSANTRDEPAFDYVAKMCELQKEHAGVLAKKHLAELIEALKIKDCKGQTPALLAQSNAALTADLFNPVKLGELYGAAIIARYLAILQSE